jgi:hypothetical protein
VGLRGHKDESGKKSEESGPMTLVPAPFSNGGVADGDELPFTVELWSYDFGHLEETLARAADFLTAKAAYEALVKRPAGVSRS